MLNTQVLSILFIKNLPQILKLYGSRTRQTKSCAITLQSYVHGPVTSLMTELAQLSILVIWNSQTQGKQG